MCSFLWRHSYLTLCRSSWLTVFFDLITVISIVADTPFEDGTFRLVLTFEESYPNKRKKPIISLPSLAYSLQRP